MVPYRVCGTPCVWHRTPGPFHLMSVCSTLCCLHVLSHVMSVASCSNALLWIHRNSRTAATTDSTPVTHVLLADRKDNCCQKTAAETVSYILSLCADRQQQQRLCQLHVCRCVFTGTTAVSVRHQQQRLCQLRVFRYFLDRNSNCQCRTWATETVSVTCLSLC